MMIIVIRCNGMPGGNFAILRMREVWVSEIFTHLILLCSLNNCGGSSRTRTLYVPKFLELNITPMEIFLRLVRKQDHLLLGKVLLLALPPLNVATYGGLVMEKMLIFGLILGFHQVLIERLLLLEDPLSIPGLVN
jgi:hypothetical protein